VIFGFPYLEASFGCDTALFPVDQPLPTSISIPAGRTAALLAGTVLDLFDQLFLLVSCGVSGRLHCSVSIPLLGVIRL